MEWTSCLTMLNSNRNGATGRSTSVAIITYTLAWLAALLFVNPGLALAQETDTKSAYIAGSGNAALDDHVARLLSEQLGDQIALEPLVESQIAILKDVPVIAIGPAVFSRVRQANRDLPIMALLVEREFIEGYATRSAGQVSAVYYDVPLLRQALTGKVILPQATRVAMLATTESVELYEPLIDQLAPYGLEAKVFIADTEDQLIPSLIRALSFGDFLLAGPDDAIYNPRNIKHILLTAYRRNKILIGPSQAYVKAGALASSYAPFNEMAELAASHLIAYFENGSFPAPTYSEEYRVEVNQQVARSLNIPLPKREWIAEAVQNMINENDQEAGQ
ncbi:ABC transporter substrate-binding protein [Marinobacter sp. EVN1]|uniref:ABC transporter substrate-binding protein n=1 Tax=Marinobacter sp. EVN1 TaxID=1397532 RepID=UPI0003B89AB3|nr:ABC transporter substrate-binding protein [Marinobacter sp. EVN1]ERS86834.1 ABC transporter substrate-binding protein [Marinobacter sp. EVN1]